jgi:hypothetical protein
MMTLTYATITGVVPGLILNGTSAPPIALVYTLAIWKQKKGVKEKALRYMKN